MGQNYNNENLILVVILPHSLLGQLIREDNELLGKTYVYTYDNAGNITSKKTYAFTSFSNLGGDSGWQIWDDVISSYNNLGRILSPIGTKAVTTANKYIGYNKRNSISFKKYLHTPGGKIVAYAFAFYAWYQTHQTIKSSNPIHRAYERVFSLK